MGLGMNGKSREWRVMISVLSLAARALMALSVSNPRHTKSSGSGASVSMQTNA